MFENILDAGCEGGPVSGFDGWGICVDVEGKRLGTLPVDAPKALAALDVPGLAAPKRFEAGAADDVAGFCPKSEFAFWVPVLAKSPVVLVDDLEPSAG